MSLVKYHWRIEIQLPITYQLIRPIPPVHPNSGFTDFTMADGRRFYSSVRGPAEEKRLHTLLFMTVM